MIILLLNIFGNTVFSQNEPLTKKKLKRLTNEATKYRWDKNYEKSLILARKNLAAAIKIKDSELIAICYNTIAANFDELAEFDKALFYYKKGFFYANKSSNNNIKIWINTNLGKIYCVDKKEYAKGINYYKKGLEFSSKIGDTIESIFIKTNIAEAYFTIGQFEKGFPYLNYVNKYFDKRGNKGATIQLNSLNGMYNAYKDDPEKAITFFEKAIALGNNSEEKLDLSFAHKEYSDFLSKKKNYKKAYENLIAHNKIIAELNREERLRKLNTLGINLELDEYKREIDNIETKQQLLIEKQAKNKQLAIIVFSLLIIIILAFYFYIQNTKLKQKNKLKDIQSKIQENIINASINGQEIERKKIASFLHDNISALLSSAGLHLSVYATKSNENCEEINKTKAILSEAHNKIRDLSHQLLPSLLVRFGLFYAVEDLCEKYSNSDINFKYSSTEKTSPRYNEDYEMKMYFIINELLNNIIKHSNAKNAKLTIIENSAKLFISIKDDGIGFSTKEYQNIEGFGLNQIRTRVNYMNGETNIKSKKNKGTLIHIIVPIVYKE